MNCDTGHLRELAEDLSMEESLKAREIPIPIEDLTNKQKRDMKVSLKDNKSKAGEKRVAYVKTNPLSKNQKRNMRNKLRGKNDTN